MASTPTPTPTPDDPTTTTTTTLQSQQLQEQQQGHHNSPRLPVQTHHCRFCNHLLLATTRTLTSLPRRKSPAKDGALILPLPNDHTTDEDDDDETTTSQTQPPKNKKKIQKHYTILLSTTIPDRKHTLVRREDGFEKRLFLRCGRCRVVMGYFLDEVHFLSGDVGKKSGDGDGDGDGEKEKERRVVYLLPGALVETGVMMRDDGELEKVVKGLDREWMGWLEG